MIDLSPIHKVTNFPDIKNSIAVGEFEIVKDLLLHKNKVKVVIVVVVVATVVIVVAVK